MKWVDKEHRGRDGMKKKTVLCESYDTETYVRSSDGRKK